MTSKVKAALAELLAAKPPRLRAKSTRKRINHSKTGESLGKIARMFHDRSKS